MKEIHPTKCPVCNKEINKVDIVLKHIKYCKGDEKNDKKI